MQKTAENPMLSPLNRQSVSTQHPDRFTAVKPPAKQYADKQAAITT